MSEEFDKEAEREKLRQQLADEEADREVTQHMSELLLKGATMTNRHCEQCGDPLFRHEGREFCPSCGRHRAQAGEPSDEPTEAAGDGGSGAAAQESTAAAGESPTEASTPAQPSRTASETPLAGEADLPGARAALARKVTALAHEAEATTDVGRARELLAAVREGAEALRALEGQP